MRLLVDGTAPSFASSGSRNVNRQPERHSRSRVRLALLRRWCLNWDLPSTTAFSPRNASHSEHHLANEASQRVMWLMWLMLPHQWPFILPPHTGHDILPMRELSHGAGFSAADLRRQGESGHTFCPRAEFGAVNSERAIGWPVQAKRRDLGYTFCPLCQKIALTRWGKERPRWWRSMSLRRAFTLSTALLVEGHAPPCSRPISTKANSVPSLTSLLRMRLALRRRSCV